MRSGWPTHLSSLIKIFAIASMAILMSAVSTYSARATVPKPIRWLLGRQGIEAVAADAEASCLLDNTRPFVRKNRNIAAVPPPSWNAISFDSFASFRAMKSALERGTLSPSVKGIMYDNEKWKFTPEEEQRDPAHYEKLVADLV